MLVRQILSGLCCLACLPAHSMDLLQAWELLQLQGPTYRAAVHERAAGLENPAIGRAGLLPQITARASKSQVDGTQEQQNALGRRIENDLDYDSENLSLQLRQPLYNRQKMVEYRQGKQRASYSEAVFDAKTQSVAVRLASRYFDVLLTRETIDLSRAKLKAFEQQVAAAKRRFDLGDGTITDVDQATARRDLAQAGVIEAEDNLVVALRLLQELLGNNPDQLATLHAEFPTPPLQPDNLQDWLQKAQLNNPSLRARQLNHGLAEEEVKRASSAHWPTLDLVLGYTDSESDSLSTINQTNRYSSIGLEFTMPLYSGGGVSARVRQATASREQAGEEVNASREEVFSATTREFRGVQSGQARIRALQQAVISSERAQESARKGFLAGSSTNVDILNAEEQVFIARRDLLEAKLRYLLARLQLAAAVGLLGEDDILQVNDYLGPELALGY
ncbi:TolC family outer membrane protein [Ectopseudomonas oleovorans]|uniref:TolC family outer membrane protein n=1 Tax=Ectopseudomonas oleovorans TaxID=301 RepID=UPI0019CFCECD|nr:TolC family outer membrane protein [Pseudomonas oleovorans]MBN7118482.1 channel protein TolC [Pseudomonas oleovorans]MBN7132155.1 channel protein TolC [Pseudomonas oleovorans]MBN7140731.1 channel protein TolC [Pseudomonas oleovorans]